MSATGESMPGVTPRWRTGQDLPLMSVGVVVRLIPGA